MEKYGGIVWIFYCNVMDCCWIVESCFLRFVPSVPLHMEHLFKVLPEINDNGINASYFWVEARCNMKDTNKILWVDKEIFSITEKHILDLCPPSSLLLPMGSSCSGILRVPLDSTTSTPYHWLRNTGLQQCYSDCSPRCFGTPWEPFMGSTLTP